MMMTTTPSWTAAKTAGGRTERRQLRNHPACCWVMCVLTQIFNSLERTKTRTHTHSHTSPPHSAPHGNNWQNPQSGSYLYTTVEPLWVGNAGRKRNVQPFACNYKTPSTFSASELAITFLFGIAGIDVRRPIPPNTGSPVHII